jgi:hypothetical protein
MRRAFKMPAKRATILLQKGLAFALDWSVRAENGNASVQ